MGKLGYVVLALELNYELWCSVMVQWVYQGILDVQTLEMRMAQVIALGALLSVIVLGPRKLQTRRAWESEEIPGSNMML